MKDEPLDVQAASNEADYNGYNEAGGDVWETAAGWDSSEEARGGGEGESGERGEPGVKSVWGEVERRTREEERIEGIVWEEAEESEEEDNEGRIGIEKDDEGRIAMERDNEGRIGLEKSNERIGVENGKADAAGERSDVDEGMRTRGKDAEAPERTSEGGEASETPESTREKTGAFETPTRLKESRKMRGEAERQHKEEEKRRLKEQQRVERKRERRKARRVMLLAAQLKEALQRQGEARQGEGMARQGEGRQGAMGEGGAEGVWDGGAGEGRARDDNEGEGVSGEASREGQEGRMGEGERRMGEGEREMGDRERDTSEGESDTSEELEAVKMEYGGGEVRKVEGAGGSLDVEELRAVDLGQVALLLGAIEGLKEVRDLPKLMSWLGGVSQGEGGEVGRAEVDQASDDVSLGSAEVSQVLYELAIAEESEKVLALLRWMEERREREWEGMITDQRRKFLEERAREARRFGRGMQSGGKGIERRKASEEEDGMSEEIQGGVVIGAGLGAPENTPKPPQEVVLFRTTSNAYGAVVTMLLRLGRVEEAEAMVMRGVPEKQGQQEQQEENGQQGQQQEKQEKGQMGQKVQQGQQQQQQQQQHQWEELHPPPIPIPHRVYCQLIGALEGGQGGLEGCFAMVAEMYAMGREGSSELKPTPLTYSFLIRALLQEGLLRRASTVVLRSMPDGNLVPRLEDVHAVMKAQLGRGGEAGVREAIKIMDAILGVKREGQRRDSFLQMVTPNELTFRMLILGLCRERNPSKALFYLTCMMDRGLMPDRQLFRACMLTLSALGITRDALELFELMRGTRATRALIDADMCTLLLAALGKRGLGVEMKRVASLMRKVGKWGLGSGERATRALIDADLCTRLLAALGKRGLGVEMKRVASLMRKWGRATWALIDADMCALLLAALGKRGLGVKMKRVASLMRKMAIPHSGESYAQLIMGYARAGMWSDVDALVAEMEEHTSRSYGTDNLGGAAAGDGDSASVSAAVVEELGIGVGATARDSLAVCNALVMAYGRAGRMEQMEMVVNRLRVLSPDGTLRLVSLSPVSMVRLVSLLPVSTRHEQKANPNMFASNMHKHGRAGRMEQMEMVVNRLRVLSPDGTLRLAEELGIGDKKTARDSLAVCNALVMAYGRAGRMEQMEMVVNRLRVLSPDGMLRLVSLSSNGTTIGRSV
ncbi:unnamed protein product [Closterium sp. Yama58-4]|nr:unnamed protein product [Closterium sp. Yama58-4]